MITLTIVEQTKVKSRVEYKRHMKMFHSIDKARKFIPPVVKEMRLAQKEKRPATIYIDGVSFDTNSEKALLLELGAIISIENES